MWKYGVMMELPEGKRAGFYAQIVKALADAVTIFDRDKELIVVNSIEERRIVAGVMEKYNVEWEPMALFLLPEGAVLDPRADDYGFTSKFENRYLYGDQAAFLRMPSLQPAEAETAPALQQIEEFMIASYRTDEALIFSVEPHNQEAVVGISRRYGVVLEAFEQDDAL